MWKTNFDQHPKNANLCLIAELAHGRCNFFCHQKKRKVKLDKVREGLRPTTLRATDFRVHRDLPLTT